MPSGWLRAVRESKATLVHRVPIQTVLEIGDCESLFASSPREAMDHELEGFTITRA